MTRLSGSEGNNEMTSAGDYYIFTGATDESGLFSVKWDGSELKRLSPPASVQHLNTASDKVVFVSSGRGGVVPPGGGKVENYDITDRMRIDLQAQSSQKFLEAAGFTVIRFQNRDVFQNLDSVMTRMSIC